MKPFFQTPSVTLYNSDCLEGLKALPSRSVDCCITSPPYFNLRDYKTATWEGGAEDCDHVANPRATKKFGNPEFNEGRPSREATTTAGYHAPVCPKCGAVRVDKQIGLEETPQEYIAKLTAIFREVRRVLKDEGTVWANVGDSYNGSGKGAWDKTGVQKEVYVPPAGTPATRVKELKQKELLGVPWRLAFALQDDGYYLRQDIIWAKGVSGEACQAGWSGNPMPESVKDRCTKSHEYLFLLSKSPRYYFNSAAIAEETVRPHSKGTLGAVTGEREKIKPEDPRYRGGHEQWGREIVTGETRNRRSVWTISTQPYSAAHFAVFPPALVTPCILAGCPPGGVVLDPFAGSGTALMVAQNLGRRAIGFELNPDYCDLVVRRCQQLTIFEALSHDFP